jgi:cytochrome c oxidase assembly protein subunit 11
MKDANTQPSHRGVLVLCAALLAIMVAGVSYSPTLYRLFCAATGYGGTVQRAAASPVDAADDDTAAAGTAAPVRVSFDANIGDSLNWEFRPEQKEVTAEIGKPQTIYYYARNLSDHPIVAHAVFNVTPFQVAPYFFKIQCFCFTDEKLGPGEEARMPVLFYLDKHMLDDGEAMAIGRVTLSYTFYEQGDDPQRVAAARDLAAGSKDEDAAITRGDAAAFDNDAPRD